MPEKDRSTYGSHMPILARIMDLTRGPVLELGMGLFSTPLLHTMCHLQQRELVSYDNDPVWFQENKKWESEYHKVHFVTETETTSGWENVYLEHIHWGVALVDHKPAKRRMAEMKRLANCANFLVVHDSEQGANKFFKYHWATPLYKYRYDYTNLVPNTMILSNYVDVGYLLR